MTQANPGGAGQPNEYRESIRVQGEHLVDEVKRLIHEGNVRHLVIKHEGHTVMEIPVTVGVVGVVLAPVLAAVGALGAVLTHCTIEVVRTEEPPSNLPTTPQL